MPDWLANRWIVAHAATADEIGQLFAIVDRDLKDASIQAVSADRRLSIAYNAGLQLATIALAAEGYRPGRDRSHERAILSLRHSAQIDSTTVDVLDLTRRKRNAANYEQVDMARETEVRDLLAAVKKLRSEILGWLSKKHPSLCPPGIKK